VPVGPGSPSGPTVDYDRLAEAYDRRYELHHYTGVERLLVATSQPGACVLEVGCGTGYWLEVLARRGARPVGVDPSQGMLLQAAARSTIASLVQAHAEHLPLGSGNFDLVVAVNALHHFADVAAFCAEAHRVLRPGGSVLTVGLDPHAGLDRWYVYEYFPDVRSADARRYPAARRIRALLLKAGFSDPSTVLAHRIRESLDARACLDRGIVTPSATSQLALLTDVELRAGVERMGRDIERAASHGETHRLSADLHLFATSAIKPGES